MTIASPMTLTFIQGLTLDYFFYLHNLGQCSNAHARFDDLEVDLDFENMCNACPACYCSRYVPADPSKSASNTELIVGVVIGAIAFVLLLLLILIGIIVRSVGSFTVCFPCFLR